jgi:superfamily II DNA/RNA helicase
MQDLTRIFKSMEASKPWSSRYSYKVKLLLRILAESQAEGDGVLVFSQSIATLDLLETIFRDKKVKFIRLDGSTKMSSRQGMMKDFNKGSYDVFLISTKAGGLGFNLPGANRVVLFDFQFNPTHEEQAIGRAYRLGQKKPVFVYRFHVGGTFEDELLNLATFKTQLAFTVVEKKNVKSQADKNTKWLQLPKQVAQEDLEEHRGNDRVLDRILEKDTYIRSIRTTETLREELSETFTAEEEDEIRKEIAREKRRLENPAAFRAEQLREQQGYFAASASNLFGPASNTMPSTHSSMDPSGLPLLTDQTQALFTDPSPPTFPPPPPRAVFGSHGGCNPPATAPLNHPDSTLSPLSQRIRTSFNSNNLQRSLSGSQSLTGDQLLNVNVRIVLTTPRSLYLTSLLGKLPHNSRKAATKVRW